MGGEIKVETLQENWGKKKKNHSRDTATRKVGVKKNQNRDTARKMWKKPKKKKKPQKKTTTKKKKNKIHRVLWF